MTEKAPIDAPLAAAPSLGPAHVRFVSVLVVQAAIAVLAVGSKTDTFGGVLPWRLAEWTATGVVAAVLVVRLSRSETGPFLAVADDLLPLLLLLMLMLVVTTIVEGQSVLAIETLGLSAWGVALFAPRLRRDSLPPWVPEAPRIAIAVANVFVDNPTPQRTAA